MSLLVRTLAITLLLVTGWADDVLNDDYYVTLDNGDTVAFVLHTTEKGKDNVQYLKKGETKYSRLAEGITFDYFRDRPDARSSKHLRPGVTKATSPEGALKWVFFRDEGKPNYTLVTNHGEVIQGPRTWVDLKVAPVEFNGKRFYVYSTDEEPGKTKVKGVYIAEPGTMKVLKVDHQFLDVVEKPPTVSNGILSIPGCLRKVDLNAFEGTQRRFQATARAMDAVNGAEDKPINPAAVVHDTYQDLVEEARNFPERFTEKADPQIMSQMAESLRSGRSLVVLGQPGAGKTSAVRAFAREVALGRIAGIPRTLRIYNVPIDKLTAGNSSIGSFPSRIATLKAAAQQGDVIYFMDELHNLAGSGSHSKSDVDGAQLLKTSLEDGEVKIFGTDTDHEFTNGFSGDPAFPDRFDRVHTKPPEGDQLLETLAARMKKEYKVGIPRDILQACIDLSNNFDVKTGQPRAAVNLLKKAFAILEGNGHYDVAPTLAILQEAAEKKYQVDPARFSREATRKKIAKLREVLDQRLVGNEEGKDAMVTAWKRKLSGVGAKDEVDTVLFFGDPGTGKTSTAIESAKGMGYDYSVIEMNKFAHGGIDAFRSEVAAELDKNPYRELIFDEIEKAHPDVQNAALSMLQTGQFTVSEKGAKGGLVTKLVKARHALMVLTSNAGSGLAPGELTGDALKNRLIRDKLVAPIVSRIQTMVQVPRPNEDQFEVALRNTLRETLARESESQKAKFELANEEEFLKSMREKFTPETDYRDVKKLIRKEVESTIADAVLDESYQDGAKVTLSWSPHASKLHFKCDIEYAHLAPPPEG